jgi:hypothetical protein
MRTMTAAGGGERSQNGAAPGSCIFDAHGTASNSQTGVFAAFGSFLAHDVMRVIRAPWGRCVSEPTGVEIGVVVVVKAPRPRGATPDLRLITHQPLPAFSPILRDILPSEPKDAVRSE